jgi:hypothetical protein
MINDALKKHELVFRREDNRDEMAVFWVVAPCSLVEVYQCFRGTCCLNYQPIFILTAVRTSNPTKDNRDFMKSYYNIKEYKCNTGIKTRDFKYTLTSGRYM